MRTHLAPITALLLTLSACGPEESVHPEEDMSSPRSDLSSMEMGSMDLVTMDQPDAARQPDMPDASLDADMTPDIPVVLEANAGESRYVLVGEPVLLDGSASTGAATYQWSPGSSIPSLDASSEAVQTFTYDRPGRYRAVLTVTSEDGKTSSDSIIVSATYPPTNIQDTSSSIEVVPSGEPSRDTIVAINEDGRTVSIFVRSGSTFTLIRRLITTGSPRHVEHLSSNWLAVTTRSPAAVELFSLSDPGAPTRITNLPPGSRPHALLEVDPDRLLVALQGTGELAELSWTQADRNAGSSPTLLARHEAIEDVRAMTRLSSDTILLTRWRSGDGEGKTIVFDTTSMQVTHRWNLPVDPRPSSDTESSGVPNYLDHPARSPTEERLYIPSTQANIVEGLALDGVDPEHDTVLRAVVSEVDLAASGENTLDGRIQFDGRGLASAALFSPYGDYLYVAMRGSRTIERIDVLDGGADAGTLFEVGHAPEALAWTSDGRYLLVNATLSRAVTVFDSETIDLSPVALTSLPLVEQEPLSEELLYGKQIFNDSFDRRITADGYIACAHCHLEGESDHLTWDFTDRGEGMRNTTSLLGRAGSGHGPIHWSANFDEPQDFEHDIREHFAGEGFMSEEDYMATSPLGTPKAGKSPELDALAIYMTSLDTFPRSPFASADGLPVDESAQRGRAIFESSEARCTTCHTGPNLTDSVFLMPGMPLLHDVGTLKATSGKRLGGELPGIDTPTLFELWNSAPYLHDGSAATLLDVLTTHNVMDQHGKTSHLTAAQLDDLVNYLLTL